MASQRVKRTVPDKQISQGDSGQASAATGLDRHDGDGVVLGHGEDNRSYTKSTDPGEARDWPMCRLCLLPLEMRAEQVVGVHIWCVHRQESIRPNVRGASYGRRRV